MNIIEKYYWVFDWVRDMKEIDDQLERNNDTILRLTDTLHEQNETLSKQQIRIKELEKQIKGNEDVCNH